MLWTSVTINRVRCRVETMVQATYSSVEEGIIWGQVWPWPRYVNISGIRPILNQLIHLARNHLHFWLCVSYVHLELVWFSPYETPWFLKFTVVCWETELLSCNKTICSVVSLPIKGKSGERFELAQSTCYEFKYAEGYSKRYLQVASFSINEWDLPLPFALD